MAALFGPYRWDEVPDLGDWLDPPRLRWAARLAAGGGPVRPLEPAPPVTVADAPLPVPAPAPTPSIAPSYTLVGWQRTRPDRFFGPFFPLGVGGGHL